MTASTLEHSRNGKVERHGLGMAQMQIAVGFWGESSANRLRTNPFPLGLDLFLGEGRCGRGCHGGRGLVGSLFVAWSSWSNFEQTLRFDAGSVLNDFSDEVGRVGESIG